MKNFGLVGLLVCVIIIGFTIGWDCSMHHYSPQTTLFSGESG